MGRGATGLCGQNQISNQALNKDTHMMNGCIHD